MSSNNVRSGRLFAAVLFLAFTLGLLVITPGQIFAQQARLSWTNVGEINPQGNFTLSLSGEVPTDVSSFELVITYDANQIEYLDYSFLIDGMRSGIDDSVPGAITFSAEGSGLSEGSHDIANLNFKMKAPGESSVTLARSYFTSINGEQIPGTMMLSQAVRLESLATSATTETTATTSASHSSSATTQVDSGSQAQTKVSQLSSALSSSSTKAAATAHSGSGTGLKIALILAALILATLIYLVVKLSRAKGQKRH